MRASFRLSHHDGYYIRFESGVDELDIKNPNYDNFRFVLNMNQMVKLNEMLTKEIDQYKRRA